MNAKTMINAHGDAVPVETIPALAVLKDETVREIVARAEEVQEIIIDFKRQTLAQLDAYFDLVNQEYGAPRSRKGNQVLLSFDGTLKVSINMSERMFFESEKLTAARSLFMECLREWTSTGRAELKAMLEDSLNTDKQGRVNRWQLLRLIQVKSDDERFCKAQRALKESMLPLDSMPYIRIHQKNPKSNWQQLNLNFSSL